MNVSSILTNIPALTAIRNLEQTLSAGPSGVSLETPAAEENQTPEIKPPGIGENVDVSA